MGADNVTTIRWGIMATGEIAKLFVKDLLIDPATRGTHDIRHVVTAVASSSSKESAELFIQQNITLAMSRDISCTAYGSYEELVKDANVDVLYIASPHSHHYQNCMLALENPKPILCEKPLTVNAKQAKVLYETAQRQNLFLMEAVWTRYFPLSTAVRQYIRDGLIGEVLRVYVDNSTGVDISNLSSTHRYLDKELAGGALLDIGIYPLIWVFQTLYHTREKHQRQKPSQVVSLLTYEKASRTDQMASVMVEFPSSTPSGTSVAHGIMSTSMILSNDADGKGSSGTAVRIQGLEGEIQILGPVHRPESVKIIRKGECRTVHFEIPAGGHGMYWEADEAGRCIRDGKIQSEVIPWDESVAIMEVVDEIRSQANYSYPEQIESTEYPLSLKQKAL
ncbi:hypothetical protein BDV37DRAFT_295777 [Aspergillus pseudonomiae]|uniref:D-xylose 1-dehydrogenase (NADP(+), D-xylono-1,5-lactone-forming) n=1 Tax=Aspergillus pseudonomiae TaxID=1506151 RepID=A0A5N7D632_9EURO|nr:uncharacterized protein BDV37DRAFT_295777 [Aspergillus pseudonomiae]KAE8401865.1 hypothetical protein BDV37DRAFT_295777 [Aspergillus pseudonomiae]